jgi:DNA-binding NarL/FixJ family response regulator
MDNHATTANILIVDDHLMVREGMTMRISAKDDWNVCGEAASEDEAMLLLAETHADLAIVDLSLKSGHGIELIKRIKSSHPKVKMLVVSGFEESLYGVRALRAGASGYLNKQASNEKLIEAIETVLRGEPFISPELTDRLVADALGSRDENEDAIAQLTDRELEVFRMIGLGHTSGAIARELFLSPHTVDTHRANLKRKINAKNAGELTRQAVQWVLENG